MDEYGLLLNDRIAKIRAMDEYVTEYFHDKNKDEGFCAIKELFTVRKKTDAACPAYVSDEGGRNGIVDTVGRYG